MNITAMLRGNVLAKCDEPCPATQDAIDAMAAANGQDRARMLDWLARAADAELCDALMVAWAKVPLGLATGRDRASWLGMFCDNYRGMGPAVC
jgi:hypothetical protein